jgi:hypothetical protein
MARWIETAASMARLADVNNAMKPSPSPFTSVPPAASIFDRTSWSLVEDLVRFCVAQTDRRSVEPSDR